MPHSHTRPFAMSRMKATIDAGLTVVRRDAPKSTRIVRVAAARLYGEGGEACDRAVTGHQQWEEKGRWSEGEPEKEEER